MPSLNTGNDTNRINLSKSGASSSRNLSRSSFRQDRTGAQGEYKEEIKEEIGQRRQKTREDKFNSNRNISLDEDEEMDTETKEVEKQVPQTNHTPRMANIPEDNQIVELQRDMFKKTVEIEEAARINEDPDVEMEEVDKQKKQVGEVGQEVLDKDKK